jgi:hypothetical protein
MTVDNTSERPTIFGFSEVLSTLAGYFRVYGTVYPSSAQTGGG